MTDDRRKRQQDEQELRHLQESTHDPTGVMVSPVSLAPVDIVAHLDGPPAGSDSGNGGSGSTPPKNK